MTSKYIERFKQLNRVHEGDRRQTDRPRHGDIGIGRVGIAGAQERFRLNTVAHHNQSRVSAGRAQTSADNGTAT